jgi:uncharacterized protein (DUF433 family)
MENQSPPLIAFDWSQCSAVERIPGKVGGAWLFCGTRLPVSTVIEYLEDLSIAEVAEQFDVSRELIVEVVRYRCQQLAVALFPPL